jgi:hypothetical protein
MRSLLSICIVIFFALTVFGQDSLNVTCVSQFALWGYASDVAVSGSYAYVANDNALSVVDIADPTHPHPVAFLNSCSGASGVAVSGHYLYTVEQDIGLKVVDISNPLRPVEMGRFGTLGWMPGGIAVAGSLAVVVDYPQSGGARLEVIDVSIPAAPSLLGQLNLTGMYGDVGIAIQDSLVYVGGEYSGLYIFNIHSPSAPVVLGHSGDLGMTKDVAVDGHYAYVASEYDGLHIVDIINPASPVEVATFDEWPCQSTGVAISGSHLCLANFSGPFRILDIADPVHPVSLSSMDLLPCHSERACAVVGQTAYTVTDCGEIIAIDVSQPSAPVELGRWATPSHEVFDVAISGNTLALSGYWRYYGCGLNTMDASDPSHLLDAGYLAGGSGQYPACVTAHDGLFYVGQCWADRAVTTMDGGFVIVDAADPAVPQELSELDTLWCVSSITFSGDYAYVSSDWPDSYTGGISVIDVHDPVHPTLAAMYGPYGYGSLAAADSILLMASDRGLKVFRISDPPAVVEIDTLALSGNELTAVAISGHYAYVSSMSDSLHVVDIATPSAPIIVAAGSEPAARDIEIVGGRVYLACDSAGLRILDIADPTQPHEIGYYDTPGVALGLTVRDSLIYVADERYIGVYRYAIAAGTKPRLATPLPQSASLSAYPNPFNPVTTLDFTLPTSGMVVVKVYDVTGRLATTLANRFFPQGQHHITFDGSGLPSGIYFARLQGTAGFAMRKLLLVK